LYEPAILEGEAIVQVLTGLLEEADRVIDSFTPFV